MFYDLDDLADTAEFNCFTTTRQLTPDEHAGVVRLHEEWLTEFSEAYSCKVSRCLTLLDGWIVAWAVEGPFKWLTGGNLDSLFRPLDTYLYNLSPPAEWGRGDVFIANGQAYPTTRSPLAKSPEQLVQEGIVTGATIGDILFTRGGHLGEMRGRLLHPLREDDSFEVYRDGFAYIAAREGLPW